MLTQSTWQHYNAATGEGTGTPALTRWIYDPATGQLAQKQHADGKGPSYGYTSGGRLASRTWARGTSTTYVYDDAGMMRSLDHSDSTPDVAFSYTRTGQLDTVQDGALSGSGIATPRFTHSYTYSSIGQLTTESFTTTVGRTLTRVYEIDGPVPGRSIGWDLHTPDDPADAPSHWQRYGFDGAGRLNAVSSPAGEYSYTYVEQSHLLASVTGPVHTVTNSYESGRDAMTSKTNAAASGTVSRIGAKYDALGRRIETSRSGSAFAQNFVSDYQYDLLGQLTSDARFEGSTPGAPDQKLEEESFAFLYDGIGNRLTARKGTDSTAYTPNALNQYTDIDGIEPVYDADGNLFSDGKNRFHWDAENRLTLVEPLVPTEGSKRLEFKYDYIGRRVSKQVWTHTGGSWTDESTTAFVYDGWNLIEEVSTSSQTASINHYTWGLDLSLSLQGAGGVGGLLAHTHTDSSGSSQTFHYTYDLNGNVSEVLDESGSIAAHYEYGPFGEMLVESYSAGLGTAVASFRFSTKYYDAELKTLYYGYRYYDPTTGRWLNRDPIEESGGLNLYGFVGNDGVNKWDLWGMNYGPPPYASSGDAQIALMFSQWFDKLVTEYTNAVSPEPDEFKEFRKFASDQLIESTYLDKRSYDSMITPIDIVNVGSTRSWESCFKRIVLKKPKSLKLRDALWRSNFDNLSGKTRPLTAQQIHAVLLDYHSFRTQTKYWNMAPSAKADLYWNTKAKNALDSHAIPRSNMSRSTSKVLNELGNLIINYNDPELGGDFDVVSVAWTGGREICI